MSEVSWGAMWAAFGALFGTFFTGLFAWLSQRGKSDSDRDIALIGQWKELTAALSSRISALESEVKTLKQENAGLLASIRQNSQSAAHLIGDLKDNGDGK